MNEFITAANDFIDSTATVTGIEWADLTGLLIKIVGTVLTAIYVIIDNVGVFLIVVAFVVGLGMWGVALYKESRNSGGTSIRKEAR